LSHREKECRFYFWYFFGDKEKGRYVYSPNLQDLRYPWNLGYDAMYSGRICTRLHGLKSHKTVFFVSNLHI